VLVARRAEIARRRNTLLSLVQLNKEKRIAAISEKYKALVKIRYADIERIVRKYARDHSLTLVFHYSDPVDDKERVAVDWVSQIIGLPACVPMHMADGVDISIDITRLLNQFYNK
jgi:hypothetical protein